MELPTEPYDLIGLPLTPSGIRLLIIELFDGQMIERRQIVTRVETIHRERGGAPPKAGDFKHSVKKALATLKAQGIADNPQQGYWRINTTDNDALPIALAETIETQAETSEENDSEADLIIGEGAGAVYIYYLPTFRSHAEDAGDTTWSCKIGRTEHDPLIRILSQAATALPETPHVAIILKTDDSIAWERAIQSVLKARGSHIHDAPGTEWFDTSPEEVVEIIRFIDPDLFVGDTSHNDAN